MKAVSQRPQSSRGLRCIEPQSAIGRPPSVSIDRTFIVWRTYLKIFVFRFKDFLVVDKPLQLSTPWELVTARWRVLDTFSMLGMTRVQLWKQLYKVLEVQFLVQQPVVLNKVIQSPATAEPGKVLRVCVPENTMQNLRRQA